MGDKIASANLSVLSSALSSATIVISQMSLDSKLASDSLFPLSAPNDLHLCLDKFGASSIFE